MPAFARTYDEPVTSVVAGAQSRAVADRCPGLLRPHQAEDGLLVRLRFPGGQTTSNVLLQLSRLAQQYGEGSLQLTSRGNLQLRGLAEGRLPALVEQVAALGLLPSPTHERVRNVLASPLSGLDETGPDVRPLVQALDAAVCATPELAELPGRFLFALDDGRGDVSGLRFDLGWLAGPDGHGTVLVGGRQLGLPSGTDDAVNVLVALARKFVRWRREVPRAPWHLAELSDLTVLDARIAPVDPDGLRTMTGGGQGAEANAGGRSPAPPFGAIGAAASVGVPLSLLSRRQVDVVHAVTAGGPVVLTPWRGLVLPGAAGRLDELAVTGLVGDDGSAWSSLTACIGAPGCAKSALSTQAMATQLAALLPTPPGLPVHVSGCPRRCGAPSTAHVDLVAPASAGAALAEIARFA